MKAPKTRRATTGKKTVRSRSTVLNSEPDLSSLRKPVDISVSSLLHVLKLLRTGTEETKGLLAYECEVIYECRVCRSLFRSLLNFISHKRRFCREKFCDHRYQDPGDHQLWIEPEIPESKKESERVQEEEEQRRVEKEQEDEQDEENDLEDQDERSSERILRNRKPPKKDLTSVLRMLQKKKEQQQRQSDSRGDRILLENLGTEESVAVFQTLVGREEPKVGDKLMKAQVKELHEMLDDTTAVLHPEHRENEGDLTCRKCDAKFSTRKTLLFHAKTLHTSFRMCYPCPRCSNVFSNTWGVYRHLFKVHRKTNEQVRKLRSEVLGKAFRKEFHEDEESRLPELRDQELDKTPPEVHSFHCESCGRRFDRKVAFLSHSHHCRKRTMLDYHHHHQESNPPQEIQVPSSPEQEEEEEKERQGKEVVDEPATPGESQEETENSQEVDSPGNSDVPEIIYTRVHRNDVPQKLTLGSRKRKLFGYTGSYRKPLENNPKTVVLSTSSLEARRKPESASMMDRKIALMSNLQKLQCLPCKRRFTSMTNLRRHMANHFGWNRYRCRLCDFRCFSKCDCVAHCNKVHQACNDRALINDMVLEIHDHIASGAPKVVVEEKPQEQKRDEEEEVVEVKNLEELQIVDVFSLSPKVTEVVEVVPSRVPEIVDVPDESIDIEEIKIESTFDEKAVTVEKERDKNVEVIVEEEPPKKDSVLQQKIMEVIFGSGYSKTEGEGSENLSELLAMTQLPGEEEDEEVRGLPSKKGRKKRKEVQAQPRRPVRNRVRAIKEDYIYDLKQVMFRKQAVVFRNAKRH